MKAIIQIPLYYGRLIIIQENDLRPVVKKYNLQVDLEDVHAFTFKNNDDYCIVFPKKTDAQIIAHESLHVVTYIFEDRKMYIENNNDEAAAYLMGWVVRQVTKRVKIDNSSL